MIIRVLVLLLAVFFWLSWPGVLLAGGSQEEGLQAERSQAERSQAERSQAERAQLASQPNILILLADDLCWFDLSCCGSSNVQTPQIDRLAQEGIRFTQAYTATAMCAPTRGQLYTGLFPVRNGAYPNHSQVKAGTRSIVHHLRALGYRVGLHGKKHFGPPESFPFEKVTNVKGFLASSQQPFCLVYASKQPHLPWLPADDIDPEKLRLPPDSVDTPQTRAALANYLTDVQDLDRQVGEVLRALDQTGHQDDTLVLFTSEQGAQWPFGKWTCYQRGLQTAFLVRWPGVVKPKTTSDAMIRYVDVVPTLIEAAGGDPAAIDTGRAGAADGGRGFDGRSFLSVLRGQTDRHADWTYGVHTTQGIIAGKPYPVRSICDGRWKLIVNLMPEATFQNTLIVDDRANFWKSWVQKAQHDPAAAKLVNRYLRRPPVELYDLQSDPWELKNLAKDPRQAEQIARLQKQLAGWMKQQGDEGVATELAVANKHTRARRGQKTKPK